MNEHPHLFFDAELKEYIPRWPFCVIQDGVDASCNISRVTVLVILTYHLMYVNKPLGKATL